MEAGITPKEKWKVWVDTETDIIGFREHQRWYGACQAILPVLKNSKFPLAVFALDNHLGWGVYHACQELGLRIPEDVSVICFDDSDIAQAMIPPMSAVAQRANDIGRIAVELLEQRVNLRDVHGDFKKVFSHVVLDVELVERQSVAKINRKKGKPRQDV